MTKSHILNVRVSPDLLEILQAIYDRDGVLPSETVRRAILAWAKDRRVPVEVHPVIRAKAKKVRS